MRSWIICCDEGYVKEGDGYIIPVGLPDATLYSETTKEQNGERTLRKVGRELHNPRFVAVEIALVDET